MGEVTIQRENSRNQKLPPPKLNNSERYEHWKVLIILVIGSVFIICFFSFIIPIINRPFPALVLLVLIIGPVYWFWLINEETKELVRINTLNEIGICPFCLLENLNPIQCENCDRIVELNEMQLYSAQQGSLFESMNNLFWDYYLLFLVGLIVIVLIFITV